MGEPLQKNSPSPPPSSLILIGTVHGDPQGYERAWRLLGHLQPDLVTVEISRFSLRYRCRQEKRWARLFNQATNELPAAARGHLAFQRLKAQVALPFEAQVAWDWSQYAQILWLPLDLGDLARRHLPRYSQDLLSPANVQALAATADGSLKEFVACEFQRAALAFKRSPWRLSPQAPPEVLKRERFLARRLKRLVAAGHRLVHLGGWEHLVPWRDGTGLWHMLADVQPLRLLLEDADHFRAEGKG